MEEMRNAKRIQSKNLQGKEHWEEIDIDGKYY
jgi:hypothetical protein